MPFPLIVLAEDGHKAVIMFAEDGHKAVIIVHRPSHKIPMVLGTGHLVKADDSVAALDGDSVSIVQGHLVRSCALTTAASTIPCHMCQIQNHECIAKAAMSESS